MPTSSEIGTHYIPRYLILHDQNEHTFSTQSVKDVTVNVPELVTIPTKTAPSTITKFVIIGAIATGIAIAVAVTVALVLTLAVNKTKTTMTTTTGTTTTSTTTTTATFATAPGNLVGYRGNNNQTYTFSLTGSNSGPLWGSIIYTDDSNVATAAVHAGFVALGQTGIVTVVILPGQSSYASTTQNGITSSGYGGWGGSYSFVNITVVG